MLVHVSQIDYELLAVCLHRQLVVCNRVTQIFKLHKL